MSISLNIPNMRNTLSSVIILTLEVIGFQLRGYHSFTYTGSNITKAMQSKHSRNRLVTMLFDSMTDTETGQREIYWFSEVNSTMDKAKEIGRSVDNNHIFAICAEKQTNGRGTRGRTWQTGAKNVCMTISIPQHLINIPLTLIPLRIGTLVRPSIATRIQSDSKAFLKWPNDILIDDRKVCGILIEIEDDRLVIGIGCNIGWAPIVESSGPDAGRAATCLAEHNLDIKESRSNTEERDLEDFDLDNLHHEITKEIFETVKTWLKSFDTATNVVRDFESYMDFRRQKLRSSYVLSMPNPQDSTCADPSASESDVIPLRINSDGTLQVRFLRSGKEVALIADYLY